MVVKRIVANIATPDVPGVKHCYVDLFGMDVAMAFGWITTLTSEQRAGCQISVASEGGSGTDVPDLSIEVDDVDTVYARAKALGHAIEYGITDEPWGVRRFYLRDPTGKVLNILSHID